MKRIPLPLLILAAAFGIVMLLFLVRRTPEDRAPRDVSPLVRVVAAEPQPYRFDVQTNGTVAPRTISELIPQVAGEIIEMSPQLVAGGFFEKGDVLARIDPADYRVDREAARAQVARAQSEFARAEKELARQRRLAERAVASPSRIDDTENAHKVAEASLREAEARLERANRDMARTRIRAPYRGRVRSESVDVGQFVNRGSAIATLYAVDYAEVRLPIPDRELAYLDVPLVPTASPASSAETTAGDTSADPEAGARVLLAADYAGRAHTWEGRLVRSEAELDPRSRMVSLVARVRDPFGLETERSAPLAVGLFVAARIEGHALDAAFVLPRTALRDGERVYVVDAEDRLRFRTVELARIEREQVIVAAGLEAGDRVCTSPLEAAIDGMRVRIATPPDPDPVKTAGPTGAPVPEALP